MEHPEQSAVRGDSAANTRSRVRQVLKDGFGGGLVARNPGEVIDEKWRIDADEFVAAKDAQDFRHASRS